MIRIQKYLSDQGICSRREAEKFIRKGLVTVNGVFVSEMGVQIDSERDRVAILPKAEVALGKKTSVILYKPRSIAPSRVKAEGPTVYDLLPQFNELDIVGRLDKSSEGLLLLSNGGVMARAITGSHHGVEKEYVVQVHENVNPAALKSLEPGITLDDGPTLPAIAELVDKHTFHITLREGRKHQIRHVCEYLHLTAIALKRVRIGAIAIGDLKPGRFRVVTPHEVSEFKSR